MKKILLTGGGTLGSVVPLIGVFQELKRQDPDLEFCWVGTKLGPEKEFLSKLNIPFKSILSGKLRRHFAFKNIIDLFLFKIGFLQSLFLLIKDRPAVILTAGSFVSVPVVLAGWLLRIPSLVHQEDIKVGLANKIMNKFARIITVTFPEQTYNFPKNKTHLTGNPIRDEVLKIKNLTKLPKTYSLQKELPLVLVMGGGTGAEQINQLTIQALPELTKFCQIIHLTGKNKSHPVDKKLRNGHYQQFDFINPDLPALMALADAVISRAGLAVLTELAYLGKPTILIPIPQSHQELNADYFKKKNAVEVLNFDYNISKEQVAEFTKVLKNLLADKHRQLELTANIKTIMPTGAAAKISQLILNLIN